MKALITALGDAGYAGVACDRGSSSSLNFEPQRRGDTEKENAEKAGRSKLSHTAGDK